MKPIPTSVVRMPQTVRHVQYPVVPAAYGLRMTPVVQASDSVHVPGQDVPAWSGVDTIVGSGHGRVLYRFKRASGDLLPDASRAYADTLSSRNSAHGLPAISQTRQLPYTWGRWLGKAHDYVTGYDRWPGDKSVLAGTATGALAGAPLGMILKALTNWWTDQQGGMGRAAATGAIATGILGGIRGSNGGMVRP